MRGPRPLGPWQSESARGQRGRDGWRRGIAACVPVMKEHVDGMRGELAESSARLGGSNAASHEMRSGRAVPSIALEGCCAPIGETAA
jgi:hypothetical protein